MSNLSSSHSDTLIIGGGVIGLACAYYLRRNGLSVRIIEKETVGAGASHGNCGLLLGSDLIPLCSPGAVTHELIRALQGTSPLYIKPSPDLSLALWLLGFAAKCNARHVNHAVPARDAVLRSSEELFVDLFKREPLACDYEKKGVIMTFMDPKAMAEYEKTNRVLEPYGLAATFLDRDAVKKREPALSENVCGGWYHPTDSHLRPDYLVSAWAGLNRKKGVKIQEDCCLDEIIVKGATATGVRTGKGQFTADHIVLATGAWTTGLLRTVNLRIPMQPGKGYSITMARPSNCPRIPCYLSERKVVVTPWASGLRLGGTMEFSGFDLSLNQKRLKKIETAAELYLKTPIGNRVIERWAGLRPMTVDELPVIDRLPGIQNLLVATGHGMLGVSTATTTGHLIADMILGHTPIIDPRPFSIRRFG